MIFSTRLLVRGAMVALVCLEPILLHFLVGGDSNQKVKRKKMEKNERMKEKKGRKKNNNNTTHAEEKDEPGSPESLHGTHISVRPTSSLFGCKLFFFPFIEFTSCVVVVVFLCRCPF